MLDFNHFADFFRYLESNYHSKNALNQKVSGEWEGISFDEFYLQVKYTALGLQELGVKPKENVGVVAQAVPRGIIADFATMLIRASNVPIYHNISEENFLYEVNDAKVKTIFVAGKESWEMIRKHQDHFDEIIAMDEPPEGIEVTTWGEMIAIGKRLLEKDASRFESLLNAVKKDDIASIIYTSGTTGEPKGVVHTHRSLVRVVPFYKAGWVDTDVYLNILPSAHIFGKMFNYCLLCYGARIYFLTDILAFRHACQEVKPTILVTVPRLLEKVYDSLVGKIKNASLIKKLLGEVAISCANLRYKNVVLQGLRSIFDRLVYSKIRDIFGGKVRTIYCGGAQLDADLENFYDNVGLPINVGWGMTEVSVGTGTGYDTKKTGTVGPATFDDIELKISSEGEVLIKGPNVMKEYYNNPEATKVQFDEEGWFRTGDRGVLDKEGYLTLNGRMKEMCKTSSGEYVASISIESEVRKHPLVEIATVIAEGKKYVTCLLFPDFENLAAWKKRYRKENLSDEDFLRSKLIKTKMNQFIKKMNKKLNPWERVNGFTYIPVKPSVEGGELTPTLKVRRDVIAKKYDGEIEHMYRSPLSSK